MPIESPMFRVELGLGPALQVLRMALNVSFFFNCFSTHFSHWIYPCLPTNLKPEWPSPLPAKSSKRPPANTPQLARNSTTSRANSQPKTRRFRCSTRPPTARPKRPISISPTADQVGRFFFLSPSLTFSISGYTMTSIHDKFAKAKETYKEALIQGKTTVSEASRAYDLNPSEVEQWVDEGKRGMENALRSKPLEIKEQYERQLSDLQQAYGEAMLELRARKKLASLLGNEDEK